MPNVIDSLVLTLGIDPSSLLKGSKEIVSSVEKTKTEVVKHGTAIEGAIGKAANSFEALAAKALTVLAIFAGARSIEQFTAKVTSADAAIGRLSASMGQSPDDISAIGKAVERMGGSADTAMSGMRGLSDAFQQFRTTGTSALLDPMAKLQALSGHAVRFGKDAKDTLKSVADALAAARLKDPNQANFLGRQILGSDDLTNFAMQGGAGVSAGIARSKQIGVVRPEDVKAAQDLQYAFTSVSQAVEDIGRRIVTAVMPYVTKLLAQLEAWVETNKDGIVSGVAKAIEDFGNAVVKHEDDIKAFGGEILAVVTAAGELAKALSSEGHLGMALAGFGALAMLQVTGPLATLARTLAALGMLNPAVLTTLGIGAVLASGDPNKSVLAGGHPDTAPQDNDLGLPGVGGRASDTGDAGRKAGGAWLWFTSKMKAMGFGDRLREDSRAQDAAVETAEGVKKLVAQGEKSGTGGDGMQGVTASSGGLGGSGRHSDGGSSPGARLGDRNRSGQGSAPASGGGTTPTKGAFAANQREAYAAALKEGLSPTAARALVANMSGEALAIPHDRHWDGKHFSQGIVQWDPERVARIKAQFGSEPKDMSVADQTRAAIWEMKTRPEYAASWKALQGSDPAAMIGTLVDNYERPKLRALPKSQRMGYYRGFNPSGSPDGAGTPAPSAAAQSDADKFKARQRALMGGKTSFLDGLNRQAPAHVAMLAAGAQAAAHAAHSTTTHHNDNSSETHIGTINVQTAATDANGIAGDMGPALKRGQRAAKANYGLA